MNNRFEKQLMCAMIILVGSICGGATAQNSQDSSTDQRALFEEISELVAEHFYDRSFDIKAWTSRVAEFRKEALSEEGLDAFSSQVNRLLASLNTSHTFFYTRNNPKRFQLLGVFNQLFKQGEADLFIYNGIGIETKFLYGKHYVASVYDGFSAKLAGIKFGDIIQSVDGKPFHPIGSFKDRSEKTVVMAIIRGNERLEMTLAVQRIDGRTMFENAMKASARVIESNGKKIGYIHIWSYAGQKYQDILREHLLWGKLSQSDSLILDIRDGWGGADLNYLNLFRSPIASVTSTSRSGKVGSYSGVWERPVVLLINGQTTSGKELFTYGFKKLKIGKVVGETTSGAVVAGRIFKLSTGDVLYLAVKDVSVDGQRLEGVGVKPDIEVRRDIQLPTKIDSQLQKAIEVLSK